MALYTIHDHELHLCGCSHHSWGSGRVNRFKRPQGITADGTFRIQMGVGGVGTPDATYGVKCEPAVGEWLHVYPLDLVKAHVVG
jgi:hypothetical protein